MGGQGCGTHNKSKVWPLPRKNVVWRPGHPNCPGGTRDGDRVPQHPHNFGFFSFHRGGFPCTPKHNLGEGMLTAPCPGAEVPHSARVAACSTASSLILKNVAVKTGQSLVLIPIHACKTDERAGSGKGCSPQHTPTLNAAAKVWGIPRTPKKARTKVQGSLKTPRDALAERKKALDGGGRCPCSRRWLRTLRSSSHLRAPGSHRDFRPSAPLRRGIKNQPGQAVKINTGLFFFSF